MVIYSIKRIFIQKIGNKERFLLAVLTVGIAIIYQHLIDIGFGGQTFDIFVRIDLLITSVYLISLMRDDDNDRGGGEKVKKKRKLPIKLKLVNNNTTT